MLTPIDIQNHSLKTAVRGYSKKETDDFLDEILKGYEELYKENRELKDKVTSLSEGIQYYKQMETTLQKALVLAEKTSTETQEAAKSKAEAMTNEAQAKAEAILKEAQSEAEAMRKEIQAYSDITKAKANRELEDTRNHVRKLVQSYENYRLQFKKLAESQIEMLESEHYSIFAPELEEMLDDAPDADAVMEAERNVPINASKDYYEEETSHTNLNNSDVEIESVENNTAAVTEEEKSDVMTESETEIESEQMESETIEPSDAEEDNNLTKNEEEIIPAEEESSVQKTEEELAKERAMAEIKIPDMEITADTIVPGVIPPEKKTEEDALAVEDSPKITEPDKNNTPPVWETPKVKDYNQIEVSKTVSPVPKEESPFTFIDTE